GPQGLHFGHQCARVGHGQAGFQRGHEAAALPRTNRRILRVEGNRGRQTTVRAKSGTPLAFAGLWETWTGPNGEEMETAAIVTTLANRTLADIHERMPVVVAPDAFNLWLDCANVDDKTAASLIAPAPDELLEAYEVSTAVNRTANDDPTLIERNFERAE